MKLDPRVLLNFAVFYAGWFACVLGAAHQQPWLGTCTVMLACTLHLTLARRAAREVILLTLALLIGAAWDSALVALHITSYASGNFAPNIAPHWIIALWALFTTTLNVSLAWLKHRYLLAAGFGAIGSALSFFAGYRMGAVQMPNLQTGLLAQAIGWAVILPLLCLLAARFNGFAPAARA
ncbi:MAG: DUF2878 domain-containing protein [Steroidobacteraceae bacterium]